jgi:hypothetical protein
VEIEEALGQLEALDAGPLPALSHGICPTCAQTMLALLEHPDATGSETVSFGDWRPD